MFPHCSVGGGRCRGCDRSPQDFARKKRGHYGSSISPERTAVNTVIQGSAADLIKLAMIGVERQTAPVKSVSQDAVANPRRTLVRGAS